MDDLTRHRLRGSVELARDVVDGAADAVGRAHDDVARAGVAAVERVVGESSTLRVAASAERLVRESLYGVIRLTCGVAAAVALAAIDVAGLAGAREESGSDAPEDLRGE